MTRLVQPDEAPWEMFSTKRLEIVAGIFIFLNINSEETCKSHASHAMALASVDKLQCVAKILIDLRLQDLIAENRKLKLELYWSRRCTDEFERALKHYNNEDNFCDCGNCFPLAERDSDCILMDHVKKCILFYGMTFVVAGEDGCPARPQRVAESFTLESDLVDLDVHIVQMRDGFAYGSKLWKAKSDDDPELTKLKVLFNSGFKMNRWCKKWLQEHGALPSQDKEDSEDGLEASDEE